MLLNSANKTIVPVGDWRAAGEFFPHRGQRVFFRRAALNEDAPVLLLVHGFPTSSWDWSPMWDALAARFTLLAPDLIGFGFSPKPVDYPYSILDQADLCEDLVARSGATRYHVLAHDYGDTVAQELLARAHDGSGRAELASVCLLNGGLFPETHRPLLAQRLLASPIGPWLAKRMTRDRFAHSMTAIFGRNTPPTKIEINSMWQLIQENDGTAVISKLLGYMAERRRYRERWVGALTKARKDAIPVRLIDGADDPISGRHMAARYRELVPDADIILLNGIGHYPQIEAAQEVLRAFIGFYDVRVHLAKMATASAPHSAPLA
jgi:pimeloyl-ACP methyl ester carboxylesterase